MNRGYRSLAAVAVTVLLLAACSGGTGGRSEIRSVAVRMSDEMRYEPSEFDFFAGETVRFEVTNAGSVRHEFFVGDVSAQEEHAADMRDMDGAGTAHEEPNGVSVEPGQTDTLEMTFDDAGEFQVGCHEPGHYQAGMAADITIHP